MIQVAQIRKLLPGLSLESATDWCNAFNAVLDKYDISNPKRLAAFFAQVLHESEGLQALQENLNYSAEALVKTWPKRFKNISEAKPYERQPDKIANKVYASRMGNGTESTGDGWNYRGRGPIQITGKDMYLLVSKRIFADDRLVKNPKLLTQPEYGAASAAWYWNWKGLNQLSDTGEDFETITKKINGGLNGYADRLKWLERTKQIFV